MPSLDDMLYQASIGKKAPQFPGGKLPKQWLPSFIRWPLRVLFYPFIVLDNLSQNIAKKIIKPPFKKVGKCKKRGNCCHYILMKKSWGFLNVFDLFWNTQVNGFFLRDKKTFLYQGKQFYVLGCRYLKDNGSCSHYRLRPMICRSWPKIEIFGSPQLLKGCGFMIQDRLSGNILKDSWDERFSLFD
jgi:hypothetical protein